MEVLLVVLPLFAIVVGLLFYYLRKGGYKESDEGFQQAGVSVSYSTGLVRIGGREVHASKVASVHWIGGGGTYGNHSTAWIEIEDMKKPTHKIDFARSTDASDFANRFAMALKKSASVEISVVERR